MYSEMILLNYEEYERLKGFEQKYIALKEKMQQASDAKQQSGSGQEQQLEKVILENQNQNDSDLKPQEIIAPITTPMDVQDISDTPEPLPKKKKKQCAENSKPPKEPLPKNWWYLGVPNYKH